MLTIGLISVLTLDLLALMPVFTLIALLIYGFNKFNNFANKTLEKHMQQAGFSGNVYQASTVHRQARNVHIHDL